MSELLGICRFHLYGLERPHTWQKECVDWQEVVMDGGIATLTPVEGETSCPAREDEQHCNCWYDGKKCCGCGNPGERDE